MTTSSKRDGINRPPTRPKRRLSITEFEQLRDEELAKGDREMNVEIFDACNRMITMNMEVGVEEKEQAWQKLQARIQDEHVAQMRRRWSVGRYILVALLSLLIVGGCIATGWLVTRWNNDQLFIEGSQPPSIGTEMEIEQVEYSSALGVEFIDTLKEMDMRVALPSYIPDGYELLRVSASTDGWRRVVAYYTKGDNTLSITIDELFEDSGTMMAFEKDAEEVKYYTADGVEYIIYNNLTRISVCWQKVPYIVSITGEITRDELIQMINSIKGEDT